MSSSYFSTENLACYHVAVGHEEMFDMRFVHTWPVRFPAFKRQKYEILVNGEVFKTVTGY